MAAPSRIEITVTPVVDEEAMAAIRQRFAARPVPELTSPPSIRHSDTPVEVTYERLRADVAALREYLVAVAESAAGQSNAEEDRPADLSEFDCESCGGPCRDESMDGWE